MIQPILFLVGLFVASSVAVAVTMIQSPIAGVELGCGGNLVYSAFAAVGVELVDPATITSTADCGFLSFPPGKTILYESVCY